MIARNIPVHVLEYQTSLVDLFDYHEALDIEAEAQAFYEKRAKEKAALHSQRPGGRTR